MHKNTVKSHES